MNILIIPSWYPSKRNPLSGSFFREQAIALHKAGHHVVVLNVTYQDRREYFNSDNFKFKKIYDEGLIVYSSVIPGFGISRFKGLMCRNFLWRLKRAFKRIVENGEQIDIIHAHSFMPSGYCSCKLGDMFNIPVVITEHSSGVINKDLSLFEIECLRESVESAACFICVGEGLKRSIIELTKTDKLIEVIPNMVSSLFRFQRKIGRSQNFIFLTVGNLITRKRFSLTIDAFAKAFKNKENLKLKIIGNGELHKQLQKQIDDLKMNGQIMLLGSLPREETALQMKECDAFVLASAYETFGVVYIEAMASGKPVIATRNGGAEWIINESNGILIDVDCENQLTEAMIKISANYDDFKLEEISQSTISKYAETRVIDMLNDLYMRCWQRSNR